MVVPKKLSPFFFFLATPPGLQDLISLAMDWTHVLSENPESLTTDLQGIPAKS